MKKAESPSGDPSPPDEARRFRAEAFRAWQLSKDASERTERRRRREVRWLRRDAAEAMRRAIALPGAPPRAIEDLTVMLENLVLTFIEQAPGRSLDGAIGEPNLVDEALSASREMVELQVAVVVEAWSDHTPAEHGLRRSLKRLAALVATRTKLVVSLRSEGGAQGVRLGARERRPRSDDETSAAALIADHVAAAWELNNHAPPGNPRDVWRTRVANAAAAVAHLRQAETLSGSASQVQQDLVYLLSALARTLLDFVDEDTENIAGALAASSEAVLRQAAIVSTTQEMNSLNDRLVSDALDTLATVHADSITARQTAGMDPKGG